VLFVLLTGPPLPRVDLVRCSNYASDVLFLAAASHLFVSRAASFSFRRDFILPFLKRFSPSLCPAGFLFSGTHRGFGPERMACCLSVGEEVYLGVVDHHHVFQFCLCRPVSLFFFCVPVTSAGALPRTNTSDLSSSLVGPSMSCSSQHYSFLVPSTHLPRISPFLPPKVPGLFPHRDREWKKASPYPPP